MLFISDSYLQVVSSKDISKVSCETLIHDEVLYNRWKVDKCSIVLSYVQGFVFFFFFFFFFFFLLAVKFLY